MEVLLINPSQVFRPGNIWKGIMGCTPPIGLALIAAVLESAGHRVAVLDANAEGLQGGELTRRLEALRAAGHGPAWIGITATTTIFPAAAAVVLTASRVFPEARIVMGGVHPTILPEEALALAQVECVVRGEGESAFLELIARGSAAGIPGISRRDGGRLVHEEPRSEEVDLGKLPLPAYHLLPMERYRPSLGSYRRLPAIGMVISRGCPGQCTFCYGHHLGRKTRYRPLELVIEEIRLLQRSWGIREICFYDDTFTARRSYVTGFCEALLAAGIELSWSCFSRADFVTADLLRLMRRAGCHQVCYGIESGNAAILRAIRKPVSFERARQALVWTRQAGIESRATFMLGNPGETAATMEETFRAALALEPDIALFNITTPFPGTEMFAWAQEQGLLTTVDWARYDLARPVMRLPSLTEEELLAFYARVHRRFYLRGGYLARRVLRIRSREDLMLNVRAFRSVFLSR